MTLHNDILVYKDIKEGRKAALKIFSVLGERTNRPQCSSSEFKIGLNNCRRPTTDKEQNESEDP